MPKRVAIEVATRNVELSPVAWSHPERILEASRGLSELRRQVLALRFVSGLSVAETASILGPKPSAIHNLQHHALAGQPDCRAKHAGAAESDAITGRFAR